MAGTSRLIKVKGKRLRRLITAVNAVRPGTMDERYWEHLKPGDRVPELSGFFAMRGFSAAELKKIEAEVFQIRIPWRLLGFILILVIIALLGFKFYQFSKLPRIYAIGNDVPVFESRDSNSKVIGHMDIWGQSVSSEGSTSASMLLKAEGDLVTGEDDNFISWLLGPGGKKYVKQQDVVTTSSEYGEYKRIFQEIRGNAVLAEINSVQRRVIYNCIKQEVSFFNASIANIFKEEEWGSFKPVISARSLGESYLFLSFRLPNSKYENLKITYQHSGTPRYKRIAYPGREFPSPLMFKDSFYNRPMQPTPIVIFKEKSSSILYQSFGAPYDNFVK